MKFVLQPSLEHMTLVKIVVSLWNQNDVRALMANLDLSQLRYFIDAKWRIIEYGVREKVLHLSLPQLLKEKVLGLIKPVGLEILMCMKYNHKYLHANLPAELCWTPQGTVDRKKTAELFVKDENYNMSTRYKLACIYCLEENIRELWNSFSEDLKKSLLDRDFFVINYWSYNMIRSRFGNAYISYKYNFYLCAIEGNKEAAEYFLQKLTPREREEWLVKAAKYVEDADILYYLISKLNSEQQMEVFNHFTGDRYWETMLLPPTNLGAAGEVVKHNPYKVLQSFLKWPFQSFFIEIANYVWDFLSKKHYDALLKDIINKYVRGYKDWNYQQLFREFWQKSPNTLKSFITDDIVKSSVLHSLFDIKDKENIRIILKHTTLTVKEKLMYDAHIMQCCQYSIRDNEWDFLEFCIRECLPSHRAMLKFKKEFGEQMMRCYFKQHFATKKYVWDQLFYLSEPSICKYDKRSLDEAESISSKRFHSLH